MHARRIRLRIVALPSKTHSSALAKSSISNNNGVVALLVDSRESTSIYSRNGRRKPSVPIEKLRTGGTAPALNNEEAWRIVPSPPNVTTRSIFSAFGPSRGMR